MNDVEETFVAVIGFAAVFGIIILLIFAAAFLLPFVLIAIVVFGATYAYFHSDSYLERKAREHTQALYQQALTHHPQSDPLAVAAQIVERIPEVPFDIGYACGMVAHEILKNDTLVSIPPPPMICNSIEGARYRDTLAKYTEFPSPDRAMDLLAESLTRFIHHLPDLPEGAPFRIPLIDVLDNAGEAIEALIIPLYQETGLFTNLKRQLERNLGEVSGPKDEILPSQYEGENIAYAYLKDTPLLSLLDMQVPFAIPKQVKYEHCLIVGGTGAGKTSLLKTLILEDINSDPRPAIVVVDSQGTLIEPIARLEALDPLIIDPRDNPTLNVFDQKRTYGDKQEQVYNNTLELFNYLMSSLVGIELTTRQSVLFSNLIRLMFKLPEVMGRNATLNDLVEFTRDPTPYLPVIEKLPPNARAFFEQDFIGTTKRSPYENTKEEIRYRLQAILANETLARLFLAPQNTIDFYEELNNGRTILIDTSVGFLGQTNSGFMGRVALTLILQAILERSVAPNSHPVHIYVDEAHQYLNDKSIDTYLTQTRKYKASLTLATQDLAHINAAIRSSIYANTSTKFASGTSHEDAVQLAKDMRCDAEFIKSQPKLTFACYIKNHTAHPVSLSVSPRVLDDEPALSDEEYRRMREINRELLAASVTPHRPDEGHPPAADEDPDDVDTSPADFDH